MIKFFRHIRHNLLNADTSGNHASSLLLNWLPSGRVGRYILYAAGEILLVVIGILIALQVNSSYQNYMDGKKEIAYLKDINNDLGDQLESIAIQKEYEKRYMDTGNRLLTNYYGDSKLRADGTFFKDLFALVERKTFVRNDPTYTELISSGNIGLLKNADLKHQIILYYQELERYENVIQNNNSLLVDQQFNPLVVELGFVSGHFISQAEINELNNMGIDVFSVDGNERLEGISNKILQKEENELMIMNSIIFRYQIAVSHYTNLVRMEKNTQTLIDEIKKEVPDNR